MKQKLINWWKKTWIFRFIDNQISKRFRRRLKNQDFTIMCPNCIGGIIYHRLGCKFLSPTVNMWMKQPDFVKFLHHLDGYLACSLHFFTNDPYPTARLGGCELPEITIYFNHAKTEQEARENWQRRKTRVNKDNLFIIMYKLDGVTLEEIHSLDDYPCQNKVIFTSEPEEEISWSYYIKPNPRKQYASAYLGKNVFGVREFEKHFDFVNFLNTPEEKLDPSK